MLKIISTGSALLVTFFLFAQEKENHSAAFEIPAKGHPVSVISIHKDLHYHLPVHAVMNESADGVKLFSVATRHGKFNGIWQSWYTNGKICDSGRLENNLPDGIWKHWNEKGELVAIRHYNATKFHRVADEMNRYHPKRHFYPLSTLFQQNKQAALFYLDAAYSFPANRKFRPATVSELVRTNITDHHNYHPVFAQCLHDGDFINYFPGGIIKDSGHYRDGLRQGKWIHRDSVDGGYWQGTYQDGVKTKEWKFYDRTAKMTEIIMYDARGRVNWRKKIRN